MAGGWESPGARGERARADQVLRLHQARDVDGEAEEDQPGDKDDGKGLHQSHRHPLGAFVVTRILSRAPRLRVAVSAEARAAVWDVGAPLRWASPRLLPPRAPLPALEMRLIADGVLVSPAVQHPGPRA